MATRQLCLVIICCELWIPTWPDKAAGAALTTGIPVEICGTLHAEARWGPPNFGEDPKTDSKFTAWIVSLKKPVTVGAGKEIGEEHAQSVASIQLSFSAFDHQKLLRDLKRLDKTVVVAFGRLWTATAPADVTPVVLSLERIHAASGRGPCDARSTGR